MSKSFVPSARMINALMGFGFAFSLALISNLTSSKIVHAGDFCLMYNPYKLSSEKMREKYCILKDYGGLTKPNTKEDALICDNEDSYEKLLTYLNNGGLKPSLNGCAKIEPGSYGEILDCSRSIPDVCEFKITSPLGNVANKSIWANLSAFEKASSIPIKNRSNEIIRSSFTCSAISEANVLIDQNVKGFVSAAPLKKNPELDHLLDFDRKNKIIGFGPLNKREDGYDGDLGMGKALQIFNKREFVTEIDQMTDFLIQIHTYRRTHLIRGTETPGGWIVELLVHAYSFGLEIKNSRNFVIIERFECSKR